MSTAAIVIFSLQDSTLHSKSDSMATGNPASTNMLFSNSQIYSTCEHTLKEKKKSFSLANIFLFSNFSFLILSNQS